LFFRIKCYIFSAHFWGVNFVCFFVLSDLKLTIYTLFCNFFMNYSGYGIERMRNEILQIRNLDKHTLNFCSKYFNIPKEQFKCYNTEQSIQKLWNCMYLQKGVQKKTIMISK